MRETIDQFLQYARPVWARRWLVLIFSFLICLAGWALVAVLPNKYSVQATIQVERSSMLEPLLKDITVRTDIASELAGLMRQTMLVPKSLESIATEAAQGTTLEGGSLQRVVAKMATTIGISPAERQKGVYTVSYENWDPVFAQRVVEVLITRFIESIIAAIKADSENARRILDEQIAQFKIQLDQAAQEVKNFKKEHIYLLSEDGRSYYSRMQESKNQYEEALLSLREAEQEVEAIRDESRSVAAGFRPDIVDPLDVQIQDAEKQLGDMELRFTDQHPDVITTKRTLEDLREKKRRSLTRPRNLDSTREMSTQDQTWRALIARAEAKAAALRSRAQEYKKRLDELQRGITTMPQLEAELTNLNREYLIREDSYQKLVARREAAIISERVEKASDLKIKVVEPPRVPTEPVGPNRLKLNTLVLAAGVGGGIGIALCLFLFSPTIYSRQDLKGVTSLPILGNLSLDKALAPPESNVRYFLVFSVLLVLFGGLNLMYFLGVSLLTGLAGSLGMSL